MDALISTAHGHRETKMEGQVLQSASLLHRPLLTGASTGAPREKYLQTSMVERVSKAVRGHWPLEGSNPSPSALQAGFRKKPAAMRLRTVIQPPHSVHRRPQTSLEVHDLTPHWRITGAQLAQSHGAVCFPRRQRVLRRRRRISGDVLGYSPDLGVSGSGAQ
jgi:hypothetical protein